MSPLPAPDPAALEYSAKTAALISREIESAGGWIPFSRFMELALYAPGLGYYSAGMHKFGAAGDFVTAPEISALF
ncbi:MAG: class I SAM-dependent methyltransferase, partial [Sulfuricella sp.]|nr:class I SAM-dependent methyltransferase [Sulfuricella sp.]